MGSTLGRTYGLVGLGAGYFVADGLELAADAEGWILQSPAIWKVTPQLRYTAWQLQRFRPYVGGFWRQTFIGGGTYPDFGSYGGKAGLYYASGRGYTGVGVVYERYSDCDGLEDCDNIYPEVSFSLFF